MQEVPLGVNKHDFWPLKNLYFIGIKSCIFVFFYFLKRVKYTFL